MAITAVAEPIRSMLALPTCAATNSPHEAPVNAGGLLTGTGTVGDTTINAGGTFTPGLANTPGTSMTVSGSLAFASGALYVVSLDGSVYKLVG